MVFFFVFLGVPCLFFLPLFTFFLRYQFLGAYFLQTEFLYNTENVTSDCQTSSEMRSFVLFSLSVLFGLSSATSVLGRYFNEEDGVPLSRTPSEDARVSDADVGMKSVNSR